jgi:serine/threonine protein kinase/Tol biopolymer transport system component
MLNNGDKLGPYEIVAPLGAGGMGEVYRARDTRLDRTVAIKILPPHLSDNAEARQRFDREARAISSLNHPNVCHLYDVGEQDGAAYLVMEYLEGETLASRLLRGPLPPDQLLKYGIEICEGLEKAHRSGVIHRDLKPGNIMLTKSGAKLMDFGLAKSATSPTPASHLTMTLSTPAGSHPLTAQGTVVGTFQYMSPEQVEGREADARSDIFALGAVLYEMATGKRAFEGKTAASAMAAVLERDPAPISMVQPATPPALERVVKSCLAKDPDDRFQSVHDAKLQLKWIGEVPPPSSATASVPVAVPARFPSRERLAWAAGVAALTLFSLFMLMTRASKPAGITSRIDSEITAPRDNTFILLDDDSSGPAVISPRATYVAFVAASKEGKKQIWVRALRQGAAKPLEGGENGTYPFWSPDEKWIGFFSDGKLKKAPVAAGPVLTLADAPRGRGGSWGSNGVVLFAPTTQSGIFQVPAAGGEARQVTQLKPHVHTTNRWPIWIPGSERFLYLATNHESPKPSTTNGIYVATLDGKENRFLMPAASSVAVAGEWLLLVQNGVLMAQEFDATSAQTRGDPVPVAESVTFNEGTWRGAFDASQNGILVYQPGSARSGSQLLWVSRDGKAPVPIAEPTRYQELRLSPDGEKLAVIMGDPSNRLWIYDLQRGLRNRLTFEDAIDQTPVWSPDGKTVAYVQAQGVGMLDIYRRDASGSGKPELLLANNQDKVLTDWSPDGQNLLVVEGMAGVSPSLYVLPLSGEHSLRPFLQGAGLTGVFEGVFSPDGKWVAYSSRESGRPEVYITSFPAASGKWQVSNAGGSQARWRRDGKALFYLAVEHTLMQAEVDTSGGSVRVGAIRPYVQTDAVTLRYGWSYDITRDGKVVVNSSRNDESRLINLLVNWSEGLKK